MTKPWTAIVTNKVTGQRTSIIFDGGFGNNEAASDFRKKHGYKLQLEALIPGSHTNVYVEKV